MAPRSFRIEGLELRASLILSLQMIEKGGFVPPECISASENGSSKYFFPGIFLVLYDAAPKLHHASGIISGHGFALARYSPSAATFDDSGLNIRSIVSASFSSALRFSSA